MFSKETVDAAGALYTEGIEGGWNKVAQLLTERGYTNSSGGYIHGQAICSFVLADPDWAHLRKNKVFSTDKRLQIARAIEAHMGKVIDESVLTDIMRSLK